MAIRAMSGRIFASATRLGIKCLPAGWWPLLLYAVGIGIFLISMPKYADDWHYMWPFKDWAEARGIAPLDGANPLETGLPWQEIKHEWVRHWQRENGRIANLIVSFFLVAPKWVGSGFSLLCWGWACLLQWRMAGLGRPRWGAACLAVTLWTLAIPWSDHMGSLDFQFNYVVGTALMMTLVAGLHRLVGHHRLVGLHHGAAAVGIAAGGCTMVQPYKTRQPYKRIKPVIMAGLALGCGLWQEGLGLPVLAGLAALMLCYRSMRTWRNLGVVLLLGFGIWVLFQSPGLRLRMASVHPYANLGDIPARVAESWWCIVPWTVALTLFLAAIATKILRKSGIRSLCTPLTVFWVVSGTASALLPAVTEYMPRTAWWSDVAACALLLDLYGRTARASTDSRDLFGRTARASFTLLALLALVHLGVSDYWVFHYRREYRRALAEWRADPSRNPFCDVREVETLPWITLGMPDTEFFSYYGWSPTPYYSENEGWYYRVDYSRAPMFGMIPDVLRRVTTTAGTECRDLAIAGDTTAIAGDTTAKAGAFTLIRRVGPYCFMPRQGLCRDNYRFVVTARGDTLHAIIFPFVSEADGQPYWWLAPVSPWHLRRTSPAMSE